MSEYLLEALSTLYHRVDPEEKKRASQWLEEWRLEKEAWTVSDSILHSDMLNTEVLLFCAQTLVVKVQQDFEELPTGDLEKLRESLIVLLLRFGKNTEHSVIHTQLALALAAFCAHATSNFWRPKTCIQWLAEKLSEQPNAGSFTSLFELLVVIPEEAHNYRIGIHPMRRTQYEQELQDDFLMVLQVLERLESFTSRVQILKVLGNWFAFCSPHMLQSNLERVGPFVQLAVESLQNKEDDFLPAVNTISELLHVTQFNPSAMQPDLTQLLEYMASSILKLQSKLQENMNEDGDLEFVGGLARLFCDLGMEHEHLILARNEISSTLVDAILAVTSHPETEVHSYAFEFWEKFALTAISSQEQDSAFFAAIFRKLLSALIYLARLPEEYLEMSKQERNEIDRWAIWDAFIDTLSVLGPEEFLATLINNLTELAHIPNNTQRWREMESLLFAIRAVSWRSKGVREKMVNPLFNALGSVPDSPVLQSAMCQCIAKYSRWLPTLVHQSGADPLQVLFPMIFKNLSHEHSLSAAVDAFCGVCDSCISHIENYLPQLMELYHQIILSANISHKWIPNATSPISISESIALDMIGAMVHGISRIELNQSATAFLTEISQDLINAIKEAAQIAEFNPQTEEKITILVARLKMLFKDCSRCEISAQILHEFALELLQIADKASGSESVVEEVCGCIRYAIKSARDACGNDIETFTVSLPKLFAESHHCGYLYVSSEITKIFGKVPSHQQSVQKLVVDQLMLVCARLKEPIDFQNAPELADDAFLMATRVVNYCPDAIFNDGIILVQILDTACKGILVHHEDACRSVLSFISYTLCQINPSNPDFITAALTTNNRGFQLTKILFAGVVGALPSKVLEVLSDALYSVSLWSEELKAGWIHGSLSLIPEQVLTTNEKKTMHENFIAAIQKNSKRGFTRTVQDLSVICRRNRVSRIASQKALLPPELHYEPK